MASGEGSDLLTVDQAAELAMVKKGTLYQWRYLGTGPKSGTIGRRVYYRRQDVIAWRDEQFARESA